MSVPKWSLHVLSHLANCSCFKYAHFLSVILVLFLSLLTILHPDFLGGGKNEHGIRLPF